MISTIDRIFVIVFARERRKAGDAMLESAWRMSTNTVYSYLGFFAVSLVGLIVVTKKALVSLDGTNAPIDVKGMGVPVFLLTVLSIFVLEKRLKKYLSNPPELHAQESSDDRRFLIWIRVISFGSFALVLLGATILGMVSTQ